MADFLVGYTSNASGAIIVRGQLQRDYVQNSFDSWIHDNWQLSPTLNINFGVRFTYNSPLTDKRNTVSTFILGQGFVGTLYPRDLNNFTPRAGFASTPKRNGKTVLRGSFGFFNDIPPLNFLVANTAMPNGGSAGVHANPGGAAPVYTIALNSANLSSGVPIFGTTAPRPPFGAFAINQDFATPYVMNMNLNLQQQLTNGTLLQVGYVGSQGRKLSFLRNINAPVPGTTGTVAARRPKHGDEKRGFVLAVAELALQDISGARRDNSGFTKLDAGVAYAAMEFRAEPRRDSEGSGGAGDSPGERLQVRRLDLPFHNVGIAGRKYLPGGGCREAEGGKLGVFGGGRLPSKCFRGLNGPSSISMCAAFLLLVLRMEESAIARDAVRSESAFAVSRVRRKRSSRTVSTISMRRAIPASAKAGLSSVVTSYSTRAPMATAGRGARTARASENTLLSNCACGASAMVLGSSMWMAPLLVRTRARTTGFCSRQG
jgi:hypothetical protein